MKYIRTKDNIFRVAYTSETSEGYLKYFLFFKGDEADENSERQYVFWTDVIKQANTIEELCEYWDYYDCLDKEYEIKPIYLYRTQGIFLDLKRGYIKDVKLCIRTNKGLIYVAKMNDKGELELL